MVSFYTCRKISTQSIR